MHVELHPPDFIEFDYAPNQFTKSSLKIKSVHSSAVCFKIRTTAPNNYVVKPSIGYLNSGESKEITITLNPKGEMKDCQKHKFSIQTAQAPNPLMTSDQISHFWASKPEGIKELRISVKLIDQNNYKTSSAISSVSSELASEHFESIRLDARDQKEFNDKQENIKEKLEKEYQLIEERIKEKDNDISKLEEEALKGFGTIHLVVACLFGILIGFIYGMIVS